MYSNILVCFDDSEGSKKALHKATEFYLSNKHCTVTVIQVVQDQGLITPNNVREGYSAVPRIDNVGIYTTDLTHPPIESTSDPHLQNPHQESMNRAKEVLKTKGVTATFETLTGNAAQSICEYAENHPIDLIIVGSSGKSGFKKFFIGSISEYVSKNVEKDLLIVK